MSLWKTDPQFSLTEYGAFIPAHLLDDEREGPLVWQAVNGPKRWPNFKPHELRSKGNGNLRLHYGTMDALQRLRDAMKRPIIITSYYRDPDYNASVGGAEASRHMSGMAVDTTTYCTEMGRWSLIHHASVAGFRGFGIYKGFTHLDTGPHRVWKSPAE